MKLDYEGKTEQSGFISMFYKKLSLNDATELPWSKFVPMVKFVPKTSK